MSDDITGNPPPIDYVSQLKTLNNQLEIIRLGIKDPVGQGYLFTAQGMITTYLATTAKKPLITDDKTITKKF